MTFGVRLHVSGERACFTRQEFKVERVSYDVMTPSAARGIIESIHWKPAIVWTIDRIHVLKPIRFLSVRRNEVAAKISERNAAMAMRSGSLAGLSLTVDDSENRQQRATTLLVDVAYVIEAHFDLTDKAAADDTEVKHISMFNRRAENGQCFHQPCLGTREFPADFRLLSKGEPTPTSELVGNDRNRDLGWMLYDIDFVDRSSRFFRARLTDAVLEVQRCLAEGEAA